MFEVVFEKTFVDDYRRVKRRFPAVAVELREAVNELCTNGKLPERYNAHELANPGGNYNGHIDFHLSEGETDVVVLYMPHKTNPTIRFVRMGSHEEIFHCGLR